MPYLTGDISAATDFVCRRVMIPNDLAIIMAVNGAISELKHAHNWEQHGTATPEEVAAMMQTMFFDYLESRCGMDIGTIIASIRDEVLPGYLPCDGAQYDREAYPELAAVIGIEFLDTETTFRVPDLRGRTLIGAGEGIGLTVRPANSQGGEETNVLGWAAMPVHNHSMAAAVVGKQIRALDTGGTLTWVADAPIVTATGLTPNVTQQPHNNMQPYIALKYYVVAK